MKVLMLGWESSYFVSEKEKLSAITLGTAEAMATHVKISLILPQAPANTKINNGEVIGLNNINLSAPPKTKIKPENLPYANHPYIRTNIPLYGTPVWSGNQAEMARVRQAGESVSAGILNSNPENQNLAGNKSGENIFGLHHFRTLGADAQILQFARHTSWLAGKKDYDIIYAYHWKTYLAATELKLATGKKLVLQVHSLSPERGGPDCKGWMYEIEKQTFDKADAIVAANRQIASVLEKDYGIIPDKIKVSGEEIAPADLDLSLLLSADLFQVTEQPTPDIVMEFLEVILTVWRSTEEMPVLLSDKRFTICKQPVSQHPKPLLRVAC